MLPTYATPSPMREAVENHSQIRRRDEENKDCYKKRRNDAIHFCGNFQEDDDQMTFYIDLHLRTTGNIDARFLASTQTCTKVRRTLALRIVYIIASIRAVIITPLVRLLKDETRRINVTLSWLAKAQMSRTMSRYIIKHMKSMRSHRPTSRPWMRISRCIE